MKKAIIVGASSGIGKELARMLVASGYKVGITGRRTALLETLKSENPDSYFVSTFDVNELQNSVQKLEELTAELGGLDLLIFSSGVGEINKTLDFLIEKDTIDTNIFGFTNIVNWAFHYFEKQGYGHLVAISSIAGLRGSGQAPAYNATKAYQINYLEGLRQKATKIKGQIHITDIRPGLVDTDMAKGEGLFWVMPVEKAARQMLNAIKGKKEVAYVTKRWGIFAGIFKRIPRSVYNKM